MPLARILAFNPEDAISLAQQLQQSGFQVEIVDPNMQQLSPADLEIEFAICDQQQVLGRAAAIGAQLQAEVVVFPGAIPSLPRPVSAAREVENLSPELTEQMLEAPEEVWEPVEETPTHRHPEPISPMTKFSQDPAPAESTQAESTEPTTPAFSEFIERLRHGLQHLGTVLAGALARMGTAASAAGSGVAGQARELRQHVALRVAQARAAREQRKTEAMQRATELEQNRRMNREQAAEARQQELRRTQAEQEKRLAGMQPMVDETIGVEATEQVAALDGASLTAEAEHQPSQRREPTPAVSRRPAKVMSRQNGPLRGAFAGVVAASFLFLAGMVLANFHAVTPLSGILREGSVEQQAPFGATTLHAVPATARPVIAIQRQETPAAAKPSPTRTSTPVAKQKSQWHHFRQRSDRDEDDVTADDVVVRHFNSPKKPPTQAAQQQAGLKRYSDE
ncbi:MAG TPA: hypothetical protein VKY85_27865 [Candidatus Angelobacter sp.]|nr:hypothetical protein [Candidatus Angelobacter sp.]